MLVDSDGHSSAAGRQHILLHTHTQSPYPAASAKSSVVHNGPDISHSHSQFQTNCVFPRRHMCTMHTHTQPETGIKAKAQPMWCRETDRRRSCWPAAQRTKRTSWMHPKPLARHGSKHAHTSDPHTCKQRKVYGPRTHDSIHTHKKTKELKERVRQVIAMCSPHEYERSMHTLARIAQRWKC